MISWSEGFPKFVPTVETRRIIDGWQIKRLMRIHHVTIRGLSQTLGITQKRIRAIRTEGLWNTHSAQCWLEAITGTDPGPLPRIPWKE